MNRFSERFQYLERLSNTNTYTINKGNLNIVFLGVCRSIYLCICFEELCKHLSYFQRAQFGLSTIAVYQMGTEMKNQNMLKSISYKINYYYYCCMPQVMRQISANQNAEF